MKKYTLLLSLAALIQIHSAFALGLPEEDPVTLELQTLFSKSVMPTEESIILGKNWKCFVHDAYNFSFYSTNEVLGFRFEKNGHQYTNNFEYPKEVSVAPRNYEIKKDVGLYRTQRYISHRSFDEQKLNPERGVFFIQSEAGRITPNGDLIFERSHPAKDLKNFSAQMQQEVKAAPSAVFSKNVVREYVLCGKE